MRVVDHEEAGAAAHLNEARIADKGCRVGQAEATEHPGGAAGGKPLLNVGLLKPAAGGVALFAALGLDRHQQHCPGLPGGIAGGAVVVDPLDAGGRDGGG